MKTVKNIIISLAPSDLHIVLQLPAETKKNLCITANLCPHTKEIIIITANQVVYNIPTTRFKSTDKADVEWTKMEFASLGAVIKFGEVSYKISELINPSPSQESALTKS